MTEKKYKDMAVNLKGVSGVRIGGGGEYTTTMYVGLMYDGAELTAPGYERYQIKEVRVFFLPKTGEAVFDLSNISFGRVAEPIEFDGVALIAKEAIIKTSAMPKVEALPSGDIVLPSLRMFKVGLIGR